MIRSLTVSGAAANSIIRVNAAGTKRVDIFALMGGVGTISVSRGRSTTSGFTFQSVANQVATAVGQQFYWVFSEDVTNFDQREPAVGAAIAGAVPGGIIRVTHTVGIGLYTFYLHYPDPLSS